MFVAGRGAGVVVGREGPGPGRLGHVRVEFGALGADGGVPDAQQQVPGSPAHHDGESGRGQVKKAPFNGVRCFFVKEFLFFSDAFKF